MARFRMVILCAALMLCVCFSALAGDYVTLKKGDSGPAVMAMKERMLELGYFTSNKFSPQFNDTTRARVKQLQRLNGLEETGIADPELQELLFSDDVIAADGKRAGDRVKADEGSPDRPEASVTPVPAKTPKPTRTPRPTKTPKATRTPKPTKTPKPTAIQSPAPLGESELPQRDEEGFLAQEGEFVFKDEEDGQWVYLSPTLQVWIRRYTDPQEPLIWYETDVRTRDGERMGTPHIANIARGLLVRGQNLARENHAVLAISDDFYFYRVRYTNAPGVIIRGGEILYDKAKAKGAGGFPKEEVLAYFQDGSMYCYDVGEYTAQEYLDMGATDVFSFGPILVTDGKPGPQMSNNKYYHYKEPRCAIGMVEPGHYVILTVRGREDGSKGCYFSFLAERMIALGVREALNLDGGGTASLIFMGEQLNYKGTKSRTVASLITFGSSPQVVPLEDDRKK